MSGGSRNSVVTMWKRHTGMGRHRFDPRWRGNVIQTYSHIALPAGELRVLVVVHGRAEPGVVCSPVWSERGPALDVWSLGHVGVVWCGVMYDQTACG